MAAVIRRQKASEPWLRVLSFGVLVLLWQLASLVAAAGTLPGPLQVLVRLWAETVTGELPYHLMMTLGRVFVSFVIAMLVGTTMGILMGRNREFDIAGDGLLVLGLNIPALIVIILCYIWLGLTEAALVLAVVINKVPLVTVTIREGARAINSELLDVAKVYRVSQRRIITRFYLPQLQPYLIAAARGGLSLIWKIVLVAELLGRSSGIGFKLAVFFQFFDIAGILAYTLAFAAVVLLVEAVVFRPLDRHAARWQP